MSYTRDLGRGRREILYRGSFETTWDRSVGMRERENKVGPCGEGRMRYVLGLDGLPPLTDYLRDMLDLDGGIGFDDTRKILLQEGVIERSEMRADCGV